MVKVKVCRVKTQTVVSVIKNVFRVTQIGVWEVNNRLGLVFESNKFYNFCITIFELNSISPVFLKNSLIVFFLNTYKWIVIIWAKNSSFQNL